VGGVPSLRRCVWNVVGGFFFHGMFIYPTFNGEGINTDINQILAAYLAGARFDLAFGELLKGRFFPKSTPSSESAQSIVHPQGHGEL
jgi:hypothetical protein